MQLSLVPFNSTDLNRFFTLYTDTINHLYKVPRVGLVSRFEEDLDPSLYYVQLSLVLSNSSLYTDTINHSKALRTNLRSLSCNFTRFPRVRLVTRAVAMHVASALAVRHHFES